jgi:hypothetical protein
VWSSPRCCWAIGPAFLSSGAHRELADPGPSIHPRPSLPDTPGTLVVVDQ